MGVRLRWIAKGLRLRMTRVCGGMHRPRFLLEHAVATSGGELLAMSEEGSDHVGHVCLSIATETAGRRPSSQECSMRRRSHASARLASATEAVRGSSKLD